MCLTALLLQPVPMPDTPAPAALCPAQRALLRTAQEIAKGVGYIHEFNIGACVAVCACACACVAVLTRRCARLQPTASHARLLTCRATLPLPPQCTAI